MQKDSISKNFTRDDLITTIEMELNADIDHRLSFVLVEGSSDKTWGENIFEQNVVFYESFSGKQGLKEVLDSVSSRRVIALRDKDYMDVSVLPDRMFTYDTSCLEMMLLKSEEVIRGFFKVYCKMWGNGIETFYNAMKALAPYSIARKKNEEQGLGINFKGGFGDLVQEDKPFPIDNLFDKIGVYGDLREQCKREAAQLNLDDLYNITNGHDICKYLGCISSEARGKTLGEEGVRNILICSYRRDDFKKTELYHNIKMYQEQYGVEYVK